MRAVPLLALLALVTAAPVAGQGILLPARCEGACPADALAIDSVWVWANLERGQAGTFLSYAFRNQTDAVIDGAFFFPLPPDATFAWVTVHVDGKVETHNEWSGPDESRRMLAGLAGERPEPGLGDDAARALVHVRIPSIPAHGIKRLQIHHTQPLRMEEGVVRYAYPLSAGAAASPAGHLAFGVTVKTEAGFVDLRSPSHAVDVQWGTEAARCPRRMRCGFRGVSSTRVKVVRLVDGPEVRARDFELVYTPAAASRERGVASVP